MEPPTDETAQFAVKRLAPAKTPARDAVSTRGAPRAVKINHKLVIFGLHDGEVRALDHESGRVWKLAALGGDDDASAFWTDGTTLYTTTTRQLLKGYTLAWTEGELKALTPDAARQCHRAPVKDIDVDSTGALIATASSDGTCRVFDSRRNLTPTHRFAPPGGGVLTAVRHHPHALILATARAFDAHVWDLKTSSQLAEISLQASVAALCWLPGARNTDDRTLALAARDATLSVWDGQDTATVSSKENVETLTLLPPADDGSRQFASGGHDGIVRAWRWAEGTLRKGSTEKAALTGPLEHLSKIENDLMVTGHDRSVRFVDAVTLKASRASFCGGDDEVLDAVFLADGARLALATPSETVRIVDTTSWRTQFLRGHTDAVLAVASCDDYVASASKDRTAKIWRETNERWALVSTLEGHVDSVGAVALGKRNDGGLVCATASKDRTLKLWDINAECLASTIAHDKDINDVSLAPGCLVVASCSSDRTAKLWDASLKPQGSLVGHKRGVWRCVFSTKERWLATCASDRTVRVWAVKTRQCLAVLQGHEDSVLSLAFLKGDQLVSGGADGVLKVWSPQTRSCECTLEAHEDSRVWALATHAGTVVSGGGDGVVRVFADVTAHDLQLETAKEEEREARDQALRSALQSGDPVGALKQALALERPHAAWGCLRAIAEKSAGKATLDPFDEAFSDLDFEAAQKLLTAIVDWNANARRAPIAQRALRALIKAHGADTLLRDAALRDAVAAYTKRHLARLDGLLQQTYLVDSVLGALERRCLTADEPAAEKRPRAVQAARVYTADDLFSASAPEPDSGDDAPVKKKAKRKSSSRRPSR